MTSRLDTLIRPTVGQPPGAASPQRRIGLGLAAIGLLLTMVTFIANLAVATGSGTNAGETLAWSFGLTTTGFGTVKLGIAIILIGILVQLHLRIDSVRSAMPSLRSDPNAPVTVGPTKTAYGAATITETSPSRLGIHRMARRMWAPMLAMGFMALIAGLIASFVWSADIGTASGRTAQAWGQGLQFLGEGMLLAGISFLLGTILSTLREGGGEIQQGLGVGVVTLEMPKTAKAFLALMMLGLMVAIAQFVLYVGGAAGADTAADFAVWTTWLGPLREVGLGLLLAGIVLALVTIGNVIGFQFHRLRDLVTETVTERPAS
jgi:hypothetical protein